MGIITTSQTSIDKLQCVVDKTNMGMIIAMLITLVCSFISIWYSKKVSTEKDMLYLLEKRASDKKISETELIAAKANEKANELEKQNLDLQLTLTSLEKETLDSKRKYLELFERFSPRSFSKEQRTNLLNILREIPEKIHITCINGNPESCIFAEEISALLKDAGWEVLSLNDIVGFGPSIHPLKGIFIKKCGFHIEGSLNTSIKEKEIVLNVGVKESK